MNGGIILLSIIATLILGMNIYVTYKVHLSEYYDPAQKYIQYALIWLLPILGSTLCYLFVRDSVGRRSGIEADTLPYDDAAFVDDLMDREHHNGNTYGDVHDI